MGFWSWRLLSIISLREISSRAKRLYDWSRKLPTAKRLPRPVGRPSQEAVDRVPGVLTTWNLWRRLVLPKRIDPWSLHSEAIRVCGQELKKEISAYNFHSRIERPRPLGSIFLEIPNIRSPIKGLFFSSP